MPISLKNGLGGGCLPRLAPELSHIMADQAVSLNTSQTTEQLALALTGKFAVSALGLTTGNNWPAGNIGVRLVIDGETIWNGVIASTGGSVLSMRLYGSALIGINSNFSYSPEFTFCCYANLKLFITVPTGASASSLTLRYNARPIK